MLARNAAGEPRLADDDAMSAWESADYERCLQLCSAADAGGATHPDRDIVRAQALLRLGRHAEAAHGLQHLLDHEDPDVRLAARGLAGAARVRDGDASVLFALRAALSDAATASPAVRAELALHVALVHYTRSEYAAAETALDLIEHDTDIVYARALEYRGWLALVRGDQERATGWFIEALTALDRCRRRDRYVEVNCIQSLAALALECFDRATWAVVAQRRAALDWSAASLQEHRFFIAMRAAVFAYDVEGDPDKAAWEARCAEEWAPSDAYRVQALCCRAQIARKARESVSQRNHVAGAFQLFQRVPRPLGKGDAAMVPLVLAEELANAGRASDARAMLDVFRDRSTSKAISMSHDARVAGFETLVEAQILEAEGRVHDAVAVYRRAFDFFSGIGSLRRTLTAAVRLIRLSPGNASLWHHLDVIVAQTAEGSWITPLAEGLRRAQAAQKLSSVQRTYLALLCDGKSNPEIAKLCRRSVHTVRNQIATLFEIFGVQSRAELVAQCARLGLLDAGLD